MKNLFAAVGVLIVVMSGCATGALRESDKFNRYWKAEAPQDSTSPDFKAYTDPAQTKLAIRYGLVKSDGEQKSLWLNIDTQKVIESGRKQKKGMGLEPYRDYYEAEWLNACLELNQIGHDKNVDRYGKILKLWESERYQSSRPRWDLSDWQNLEVYGVAKDAKVRTDKAGQLGVSQEAGCWLTLQMPEDYGGGFGVIEFDLPNCYERTGAFYAVAPFAAVADIASLPVMIPVTVVGNASKVSGKK